MTPHRTRWITRTGLASTVTADRMTSLEGGIARSWRLPPGISIDSAIVYLFSSLYHSFLQFTQKRWFLNKPNCKRKYLHRVVTWCLFQAGRGSCFGSSGPGFQLLTWQQHWNAGDACGLAPDVRENRAVIFVPECHVCVPIQAHSRTQH